MNDAHTARAQPTAPPRLPGPHPSCAAPHVVRDGSITGRQRHHGHDCSAWFGETADTPLSRSRTPLAEVARPAGREAARQPARGRRAGHSTWTHVDKCTREVWRPLGRS